MVGIMYWAPNTGLGHAATFNFIPQFGEGQDNRGHLAIVPTCEHQYLRFRDSQDGWVYQWRPLLSHSTRIGALKTVGVMQLLFVFVAGLETTETAPVMSPKCPHVSPCEQLAHF